MSMKWWSLYGPFDPGEDGLPHMGQVISHYAKLSGLKTNDLAFRLTQQGWKVGERRMEQLLSQHNLAEPQQISRRRLLTQLLAIPPALLGLSQVIEVSHAVSGHEKAPLVVDADTLVRYESALATYWDSFYTSSVQRYGESIERWRAHLDELSHTVRVADRTHILMLLCRFQQLAAVAARDQSDFVRALHHHDESVRLAQELNNAELLAASLFRRAKTRTHQRRLDDALADVNAAIPYAQRSRDQLRGYVYQMAAEVISQLPPSAEQAKRYRFLMDETGKILRKGVLEDDGSFARLTMTGYQQDRARGFLRLGDHEAALDAIAVAEKTQDLEMTRWQAETSILRAHTLADTGEVEWACSELEEAIPLVRATRSGGKKRKVTAIYKRLAGQYPAHAGIRHIGALLAE